MRHHEICHAISFFKEEPLAVANASPQRASPCFLVLQGPKVLKAREPETEQIGRHKTKDTYEPCTRESMRLQKSMTAKPQN